MAIRILVLASIICALVACGGGGSSVPPEPVAQPVAAPATLNGDYVTAYGDSTQAFHGNPHASSIPGLFTITNRGISGSTSTQLLSTWEREMAGSSAVMVIINHGLNDGDRTLEQYKDAMREFIRIARKYKKIIVLEQPNNAAPHSTFDLPAFEQRRAAVGPLATAEGVYYCEQPDVPLRDGAHPTDDGYRLKAARLADCIGDILK